MPEIGAPNINFLVLTENDPQTLCILDISKYLNLSNSVTNLLIKIPGAKNYETYTVQKNKLNYFNSNTLHISCVQKCGEQEYQDLPDGIYHIILESTPNSFRKERWYLKTDALRLKVDKIYLKQALEYDPKSTVVKELRDFEFMLQASESATKQGDYKTAQKYLKIAQELANKNSECKNCI